MTLSTANYSILTPYILPPNTPKKVNAGDGFIMDSSEKLLGARATHYFSARAPLTDDAIARINETKALIVTGANTLKDDYGPTPGFTLETLARLNVPVILMGVGHYGAPEVTRGMHPPVVALLTAMAERFPYFSVRCGRSHEYVVRSCPALKDHFLMTSCPVAYAVDGIDRGFTKKDEYDCVVVTLTDRSHTEQQLPILIATDKCFRARRKILAFHQDYGNQMMHQFARQHGYEIFATEQYQDYIDLYAHTADLHIGNRVHGHLKSLSLGLRSFLLPFDLRQVYFAESLDFPLITQMPNAEFDTYDFSRFTTRRAQHAPVMERFVAEVRKIIGLKAMDL